jgi:hypothetical protein
MGDTVEKQVIFRDMMGKFSASSHSFWEIVLRRINVHILEMEDVLFHHNSAVMMPENPAGKSSKDGAGATDPRVQSMQATATGIKALALVFKQFEFDPNKRIIIAGHADTSGDIKYNFELSGLRAQNVMDLLIGDREAWTDISYKKHKIEDYQQIMTHYASKFGWACDPEKIDNVWGPKTEAATKNFIDSYNTANADPSLPGPPLSPDLLGKVKNDGAKRWPPELWRAVFDLYSQELAEALMTSTASLQAMRESLVGLQTNKFLYPDKRFIACGESFPIDQAERDKYRSQANRRVEIIFFDKDEALAFEDFVCPPELTRTHKEEECPMWNKWHFLPLYIDPDDLYAVVYHLRFVYYDRVLRRVADVPDGLTIRALTVRAGVQSEIPTAQVYRNGIYYVKVKFSSPSGGAQPDDFYFQYQLADAYVVTPDGSNGSDSKIEIKKKGEIPPGQEHNHHALPSAWTAKDYCTYYKYPDDYPGPFEDGGVFLPVCKDTLNLRPFGTAVTQPEKPLTFILDPALEDAPGIILFPSLGCPALVSTDLVFVLVMLGVDASGNDPRKLDKQKVNNHLKFLAWPSNGGPAAGKSVVDVKRDLLLGADLPSSFSQPLFPSLADAEANIEVAVWPANQESSFYECNHLAFLLHQEAMKRFASFDGVDYKSMYAVTLKKLPAALTEGVFNAFWINRNSSGVQQEAEDAILQHLLTNNSLASGDATDQAVRAPNFCNTNTGDASLWCSFKILDCGHYPQDPGNPWKSFYRPHGELCLTEIDPNLPICSFHPVLFKKKDFYNAALLGDLHLSARLNLLKRSRARVIEHQGIDQVGSLVNEHFETAYNLIMQAGADEDVDMVLLAGDLIDFIRSFYPANFMNERKKNAAADFDGYYASPQTIWQDVGVDNEDATNPNYLESVDFLAFYSLLIKLYLTNPKPVFLIVGNHDPYYWPWGISPRVIDVKKANENIPADANLTIYEAVLAYGEKYGSYGASKNFMNNKFVIFHTLFTPFTDFALYMPRWTLTGLSWGDDEDLVDILDKIPIIGEIIGRDDQETGHPRVGHLPRAENAITDTQLALLKRALDRNKERNLLLTHFTFVSYLESIPLHTRDNPQGGVEGDVEFDWHWEASRFDMGTFEDNRKTMYETMFHPKPKIHYVLTGHSHRRGLYEIFDIDYSGDNSVRTRMWDFSQFDKIAGAKIVVTDSGGPIPRFNYGGEFRGWGSNRPSYARLILDGSGGLASLSHVDSTNPKAKPRFAVAVDYLYVIEHYNVMWNFESSHLDEERLFSAPQLLFALEWTRNYDLLDLAAAALYCYFDGSFHQAPAIACSKQSDRRIFCTFDFSRSGATPRRFKEQAAEQERRTFLSLKFKPVNYVDWNYNYDSFYNFEVLFTHESNRAGEHFFRIERPSNWNLIESAKISEIPDFEWRKQLYPPQKKS